MRLVFTLLFSIPLFFNCFSQNFWTDAADAPNMTPDINYSLANYRTLSLNLTDLKAALQDAPMEFTSATPLTITFPMSDGTMEDFGVFESPIMESGLAAANPGIKTFSGKSLTSNKTMRFDYNPENFHAIIHFGKETTLIHQYSADAANFYLTYNLGAIQNTNFDENFSCDVDHNNLNDHEMDAMNRVDNILELNIQNEAEGDPVDLRTFRFAVATTGEYYVDEGNSDASVLASVTSVTNQINSVFERDAAVRLILVDNIESIFYDNQNTDPYTNGNTEDMIEQNVNALNGNIGVNGYDIGHVFGKNGGGLASLGSVCDLQNKARGASNEFAVYQNELFYIVAGHEVGHQFTATHNFNSCDGENESANTAYEPGSGSSIMCYNGNGVCGSNHLQDVTDDYFHINAMGRIQVSLNDNFLAGACAQVIPTNNTTPSASISISGGFNIPISTPFELTGSGSDDENDDLTYSWEQYNLGPVSNLGSPILSAPTFRSFPPSDSPMRVFPRIDRIVNNENHLHEFLPDYSRELTFRFSVRDNNIEGGGHDYAEIVFNTTESAGPFLVSSPNVGDEVYEVNDYVEVTWNVANTDNNSVNCQKVNIKLSTDGGFTYPITLIDGTSNDGSAYVNIPNEVTNMARIRVEAANNIFFDISNANFSIIEPTAAGFGILTNFSCAQVCWPQPYQITLETSSLMNFDGEIAFGTSGDLPPGATVSFDPMTVAPGNSTVMTVDFSNTSIEEVYTINVTGTADGADTETRFIETEFIYNNFEDLKSLTPNASNTNALPIFSWEGVGHADSYEIEISTSPLFDNIVCTISDIAAGETTAAACVTLESNTQYFWKIRAINECGAHNFTNILGFQTSGFSCSEVCATDGTINISDVGTPQITTTISIPQNGVIDDLNLTKISGQFDGFGDLEFELTSPTGTSVILVTDDDCLQNQPFNFGLNDEAALSDFGCPPVNNGSAVAPPANPLSTFNGENANGTWTLKVRVTDSFGTEGGQFDGWGIEFCGAFSSADPVIALNETMCVTPGDDDPINENFLIVTDDDNTNGELVYTVVTAPTEGVLLLNGSEIFAGATFTHDDILNNRVRYSNVNEDATTDSFTFTISDGEGGFVGTPSFQIEILESPDCVSNTEFLNPDTDILVYPNPANEVVFVEFKQVITGKMTAKIFDVQGREMSQTSYENTIDKIELNTANLAAGVYFINFIMDEGVFTKKMTIE